MVLLLSLLACGEAPEPEALPAAAPVAPAAVVEAEPDPEVVARMDAIEERLDEVEISLGQLQLVVAEFEKTMGAAEDVRYNPSATTLQSKDVQEAIDELAIAVRSMQGEVDMGQASGELFRIPKDSKDEERQRGGPPKGKAPPPK